MKDRVLCIDDDRDQAEMLGATLEHLGYVVTVTTSPSEAIELVRHEEFDVIVTDLGMSEMDGFTVCERMMGTRPDTPVIVVTGHGSMEAAIGAMRAGAYDFMTKPLDPKLLALSVARAAQHSSLRHEILRLREAIGEKTGASKLVGESTQMRAVSDLIARIAKTDASVLICGETGTGKELVAHAVHASSSRKEGPFVAINCAAVPPNLLESELFGHVRGAFTDAKNSRQGLFVEASGGTLFLDEIGEMPLEMQVKLLRAIQERKVRPVGANSEVSFDSRIVTATHRDLEAEVDAGRFRQDLYYRINVVRIDVPPLRERGSDALELASYFLRKAAEKSGKPVLSISPQVAERLLSYDWPGNVRELENCIERAVALAQFEQLTTEDMPDKIRAHRADRFVMSANDTNEILSLDELERRYILRVIKLLGGNKARAAQLLGLDRRTLYRRLDRYAGKTGAGASERPERLA